MIFQSPSSSEVGLVWCWVDDHQDDDDKLLSPQLSLGPIQPQTKRLPPLFTLIYAPSLSFLSWIIPTRPGFMKSFPSLSPKMGQPLLERPSSNYGLILDIVLEMSRKMKNKQETETRRKVGIDETPTKQEREKETQVLCKLWDLGTQISREQGSSDTMGINERKERCKGKWRKWVNGETMG